MNAPSAAREMTARERAFQSVRYLLVRLRRHLPYIVWYGDEIDCGVTFSQEKLDHEDPLNSLFSGDIRDIEDRLRAAGISFDSGIGWAGRDWEWDWSLAGPISVRFRRRAERPERRRERPKPRLAYSRDSGSAA